MVQRATHHSNTYIPPLSYLLPNYILPSFSLQIQELWGSEFHALTREGNRPVKPQAFPQHFLGATNQAKHFPSIIITLSPDTRRLHSPCSQRRSQGMGTGAVRIWKLFTREPLALSLCPLPLILETKDSQCTWMEQLHWTLPKDYVIRGKPVMISTKHGWRERFNDIPGTLWFLMTDFSRSRSYTYQRKLFKELLHTLPFLKRKEIHCH